MSTRLPLVVILGATGTGKTKLSLELARKFGAEIIGADSMQVYRGLDIITAKATPEEQSSAPHHLIDFLEPHELFTVTQYKNRALKVIEGLMDRNRLPVVVGGTNYYIEALLWKILIDDGGSYVKVPGVLPNNEHELPSEELHERLRALDPSMARRLHPNNKRKILRSLEILHKNGKRHSELLEEQQSAKDASRSGGGLRFDDSLVLWLQCNQDVLNKRLDDRVDKMLEHGLLDELLNFHKLYNQERVANEKEPDYSRGIFQSIGFKEFHPYLMLNEEERTTEDGRKKLEEGIDQLKLVTRRFARKQNRWIANRFLGRTDRKVPPVYGLDTTDVSRWDENVGKIAYEIVQSHRSGAARVHEPLPMRSSDSTPNSDDTTYTCEVCDRIFVGQFQWTHHRKSNRHKKMLERNGLNHQRCRPKDTTLRQSDMEI